MKKTILILALFTIILSACKKDEDKTPTPSNNPSFSMKVNGISYVDDGTAEGLFIKNHNTNVSSYALDQKSSITVYFEANAKGTYTVGQGSHGASYISYGLSGTDTTYYAQSGSINVSEYDTAGHQISGTFNLVVRNSSNGKSINLTEGKFENLSLTEF
jgi:hypothetical protein